MSRLEEVLSPSLRRELEFTIASNKDYQKLQEKHKDCLKRHDYLGALRYSKIIDEVEKNIVQELINYRHEERVDVRDLMKSMPDSANIKLSISLNLILFCIDQIDYHITVTNEIMQKYHPDCKLEIYNKLNEANKLIKDHMKMLGEGEESSLQIVFGDIADNLTEMMVNKVKAYIRKKKQKEGELV